MRRHAVRILGLIGIALAGPALTALAAESPSEQRLLNVADLDALRGVSEPRLSPDGAWVAYTVRTTDAARDKRSTDLWMTSWDGRQTVQLTHSPESEHSPGWSPNGRYLAFLSNRGRKNGPDELWLLDRSGGDALELTQFKGDVVDYDWSPDGGRIALVVADDPLPGSDGDDDDKTPPPLVIDRFYFKEDETGYLSARQMHLYLLDVASRKVEPLTSGRFTEAYPAWSPDGLRIAFMSKRSMDPDRDSVFGLYVIPAIPGAAARLVTTLVGEAGDSEWMSGPVWSPNGRDIAYVGASDAKLVYYAQHRLMVVPAAGGTPRAVSGGVDRDILAPVWSDDGRSIYALVENDRNVHFSRFNVANGRVETLLDGRRNTTAFELGAKGRVAVLDSTPGMPDEVFALDRGKLRPLSRQNDQWLSRVELGTLDEITFSSRDGTRINGFLLKPPHYTPGFRYPTLLQIHGGPVSQYANAFNLNWQILAAQGYVIVAANPRGSSGRGEDFAKAIYADWGNKDTDDVLAAVDYAVEQGVADATRLGVGGWSYGGMLTDNVIARDRRFRAAVSGASTGNALAGYGTDMYIREYEGELGVPWKNLDVYLRNSYPFLHADRIVTPTLFMCGDLDFNVPLLNSEQMYQALKSLGVDTELVIYPGQYHSFSTPSYLRDRLDRWIAWYGKYITVPPRPIKSSRAQPAAVQVARPPSS